MSFKFKPRMRYVATSLIIALVAGCATNKEVGRLENRASPLITDRLEASAFPNQPDSSFSVNNGFYAARKPIMVSPVNPSIRLPESFYKNTSMNVQSATSLTELAARISRLSGYQVSIDQDVLNGGTTRGSSATRPQRAPTAPAASTDPSAPPSALPPLPGGAAVAPPSFEPTFASGSDDLLLNKVVFEGNLSGLLDTVTGRLNLSWRWTGDRVEIFRYETKIFRLNALAGSSNVSTNLNTTSSSLSSQGGGRGGSSGSGGTQGSSGSNTSVSSTMEIWGEVEKSVESILSEKGVLSSTPSAGTMTVRDTPQVLRQVEAQISEFNRIYSRQVMLNVEVYAIERSSADSAAVDWNAVWNSASSRYGFGLNTSGKASGSANSFTLDVKNGPFAGSKLVASVLSTVGNSTLLTSAPVTTLNGQTVPLNISRDQAYVAEYSTTLNGVGGSTGQSTTTITPGVVSEGFSMNVTPRVLDDNNVIIRYAVDLSTIEGIQEFTSPDGLSAIQLPRRAVRNFLQNVNVKSGETLVLTGFQQITGTRDDEGPGSTKAWFMGGKKASQLRSRTLVIVITPYVMQ